MSQLAQAQVPQGMPTPVATANLSAAVNQLQTQAVALSNAANQAGLSNGTNNQLQTALNSAYNTVATINTNPPTSQGINGISTVTTQGGTLGGNLPTYIPNVQTVPNTIGIGSGGGYGYYPFTGGNLTDTGTPVFELSDEQCEKIAGKVLKMLISHIKREEKEMLHTLLRGKVYEKEDKK